MVPPNEDIYRQCLGKSTYSTMRRVRKALRNMRARGQDNDPNHPLMRYLCKHCGQWHIGHMPKDYVDPRQPLD